MKGNQEIEVKYLLTLAELAKEVDLASLPVLALSQSYFSRGVIKSRLIPLLEELCPDVSIPRGLEYKNGRIRSVTNNNATTYSLTVKGPRQNEYSRLELETEISADLYEELLKQADCGTVKKNRYLHKGALLIDTSELPITAEIDLVTEAAGAPIFTGDVPEFVIIEVELLSKESINPLRQGKHDFSFLSQAIEIASLERSFQTKIRMRDLARFGLTAEAKKLLNKLFTEGASDGTNN